MAFFIDDSGTGALDAELSGTYTMDSINRILTMGATGSANSTFVLPSVSEWILVETVNVGGAEGDLGDHWWTDDVTDVAGYIAAKQAIVDAEYVLYEIKATHYLTGDLADVYEGSNSITFPGVADYPSVAFTPSTESWKITDTFVAPVPGPVDPLGPELFTNSGFTDNVLNWASIDAQVALSWDAGTCFANATGGSQTGFWQSPDPIITVVPGKNYRFSAESTATSGNSHVAFCGKTQFGTEYLAEFPTTVPTLFTVDFTATSTDFWYLMGNKENGTVNWDYVSLKEIL